MAAVHLTKTHCLLSCMDVKSGHWLITVCTQSAFHGTTVFGVFFSVVGVRTLFLFSFSIKQCQLHIDWLIRKSDFFGQKISESERSVLKDLSKLVYLKRNTCNALRSKYGLVLIRCYWRDKICGIREFFRCSCDVISGFFLCLSVGYMHIFLRICFMFSCFPCGAINDKNDNFTFAAQIRPRISVRLSQLHNARCVGVVFFLRLKPRLFFWHWAKTLATLHRKKTTSTDKGQNIELSTSPHVGSNGILITAKLHMEIIYGVSLFTYIQVISTYNFLKFWANGMDHYNVDILNGWMWNRAFI